MTKLRVLCAKSDSPSAVRALYDFGAIEVREQKAFPQSGKPLPEFSEISNALIELRPVEKLLETLPAYKGKEKTLEPTKKGKAAQELVAFPKVAGSMNLDELLEEYRKLPLVKFKELEKQSNALKERAFALSQKRGELLPFKNLNVKTALIYGASRDSRVRFAFFELKPRVLKEAFEKALKKELSKPVYCSDKGREFALVAFPERAGEKMRVAATPFIANELTIPVVRNEFFGQALEETETEIAENTQERTAVLRELNAYKKLFFTKIFCIYN
jgi:vacuolar-type H+-ATPase subunit I/STV1